MPKIASVRARSSVFGLENIWEEGRKVSRISSYQMMVQLALQAWRSFIAAPFTSFLTVLTSTVVLLVFGAFVMILENVSGALLSRQSNVTVRLFLQDSAGKTELEQLKTKIESIKDVENVQLVSKAQALSEFRSALGDQVALVDGLEQDNPLPASLEVRLHQSDTMHQAMEKFVEEYHSHPLVQHVQYSHGVLGRLTELLQSFRIFGSIAIGVMFLIAAFVISVTIRLALYAHRQEIAIMKLVGATNRFIRTPFLMEGATQGLVGACAAIGLLFFVYGMLKESGIGTSDLWVVGEGLKFLSPLSFILVLLSGPIVGLFGSYLAVRKLSEE